MNGTTWLLIGLAVLVTLYIVRTTLRVSLTRHLKQRFGSEYHRLVVENRSRQYAERELKDRERRVRGLRIRPLDRRQQIRYTQRWVSQETRFVDAPSQVTKDASHLLEEVMLERGYPAASFEQRAADISVHHADLVERYRAAHEIDVWNERGQAETEDLRIAMLCYRDLLHDLLEGAAPRPVEGRRATAVAEYESDDDERDEVVPRRAALAGVR